MSPKSIHTLLFTLILWCLCIPNSFSQQVEQDSTSLQQSFLPSKVTYVATDSSIINLQEQTVLLYHQAQVNYEDIELKAEHIILNWENNTVFAIGLPDSTGNIVGTPIFSEGGKTYRCESILYNFNTKKGKIKEMKTQDGEGYIHGSQLKKNEDNSMYIKGSKYTTCSDDHPHFYIGAKKLKVIPGDKIVSGPANLVISDIPTPLFVPFGFFPMQNKQSSGFIMPTYGYSPTRGYNFRNGGWYFAINDYMDLALRGDIYTLGSWLIKSQSTYKKKYAYSGNFSLSYSKNLSGDRGFSNFKDQRDFFVKWTHIQDKKAHPNRSFTAKVNAGSSTFNQLNSFQSNDYLQNTLTSNVSYNYSWPGKPYNFSANLRHSQNTLKNSVSLSLPDIAFNINSITPFERKAASGRQKWYEKIRLSYDTYAKNQIETTDSLLFRTETLDNMKYGIQHRIPINSSFKIFKYFNLNPSLNYTERWYFNRIEKSWNEDSMYVEKDTINGMRAVRDFNTNLSLNTKIYGLYQFKSKKIKAIRHVFTPSITFSYRPDFSEDKWGYYDWTVIDTMGTEQRYSYYDEGIYKTAPSGKSGLISLNIDNNVEIKVRSLNDTIVEYKKIALFKNLNFRSNYNLALDSFNLAPITFRARTELLPKLNINFDGRIDPYKLNEDGYRINKYAWKDDFSIGRMTYFNVALDWRLNSSENNRTTEKPQNASNQEWEMIQNNPGQYVDFNIPWNISLAYKYTYNKPGLEKTIKQTFNFNGNVRLTEKWKIGFRSGYDFDAKEMSYTSLDFYRDLHCWEMRFEWVPFGYRQSFNLSINVKSAILQDLKLNKRKNFFDF